MTANILGISSGQSFNQPRFCPSVSWHPNATTFANSTILGSNTSGLFVNTNNTVYMASMALKQILIWQEGNTSIARTIPFNRTSLAGLFVTTFGDIYIHEGQPFGRIQQVMVNASNATMLMNVPGVCFGLFITTNGTLYCSFGLTGHHVGRTTLVNPTNFSTVAGVQMFNGTTPDKLNIPYGIVLNDNFGLYVADFGNNRIQFFPAGQTNATTVAGAGAPGTIALIQPDFITLDGNGYLYILEYGSSRLVGAGPNGFRCIVGCTNTTGSASNKLFGPANFAFDSYGNIFVSDMGNSRIQKFILATNSCGKHDRSSERFLTA
jgi:hypothetical protein